MKNKLQDLNNALFLELERLQDEDVFKDDEKKLEQAIKRADAVNNLAGSIVAVHRVRLDMVKTALDAGYAVAMPESLQLEMKPNG